jgi:Bacterial regulatory proteins, luxR family
MRTVVADEAPAGPSITRYPIEGLLPKTRPDGAAAEADRQLTGRELEVVKLVAKGLSNADLAERLHLSDATVKSTSPASQPGRDCAAGSERRIRLRNRHSTARHRFRADWYPRGHFDASSSAGSVPHRMARPTGSVTLRDSQSRAKSAAVDHGPMCR